MSEPEVLNRKEWLDFLQKGAEYLDQFNAEQELRKRPTGFNIQRPPEEEK